MWTHDVFFADADVVQSISSWQNENWAFIHPIIQDIIPIVSMKDPDANTFYCQNKWS